MKHSFALVAALAMLLLCSCSIGSTPAPAATAEPSPAAATEAPQAEVIAEPTAAPVQITPAPAPAEILTEPTSAPAVTVAPSQQPVSAPKLNAYDSIITKYRTALQECWDNQKCVDNGVNRLVPSYHSYGNADLLGYCTMDVNSDGVQELLIGDGKEILAMYTNTAAGAVQVCDGHERSSFYLEPDGLIVNRGSNSAFQGGYSFYKLQGSSLVYQGAIIWDYSVNNDAPWFYAHDEDWNVSNDEKVSNATAHKWIEAYEGNYVSPTYISFTTGAQVVNKSFEATFYAAQADDYGYQVVRAPQTGYYEFAVIGSSDISWDVYVLDQEFTDALRFIGQAYEVKAHNGGTVYVQEGQYLYVYCSANQWTTIQAPAGAGLSCKLK